jgi:hypothetical protein
MEGKRPLYASGRNFPVATQSRRNLMNFEQLQKITEEFHSAPTLEEQNAVIERNAGAIADSNRVARKLLRVGMPLCVRLDSAPALPFKKPAPFRNRDRAARDSALRRAGELLQKAGQKAERRHHLSVACPHCKAFAGMLCVTVEGRFPGREQYSTHAARRRAA